MSGETSRSARITYGDCVRGWWESSVMTPPLPAPFVLSESPAKTPDADAKDRTAQQRDTEHGVPQHL